MMYNMSILSTIICCMKPLKITDYCFIKYFRHDVLEGVGKLHLSLLLSCLIRERRVRLDDFNDQLIRLDYG